MIILDDLQWADKSSLHLLQFLAREVSESRILVLGAYRDNEVDEAHPLSWAFQAAHNFHSIHLGSLVPEDMDLFLADTFKTSPSRVHELG